MSTTRTRLLQCIIFGSITACLGFIATTFLGEWIYGEQKSITHNIVSSLLIAMFATLLYNYFSCLYFKRQSKEVHK